MRISNLELCKRIAEIDGLIISNHSVDIDDLWVHTCNFKDSSVTLFNPLTDDALCFKLMVKYKLSLIAPEREQVDWDCVIRDVSTVHKSPNKAICLAIIEAHK